MNVLIFVVTMLMLLALLTYSRLETYFSSQVFQTVFNQYMVTEERSYINQAADKLYGETQASKGASHAGTSAIKATPRLSLILLQDREKRTADESEWPQRVILLKNLMTSLYEDQPFFQRIQQKNPLFLDELIAELTQAIDALPQDQKLKKAADLANITLKNPELDIILYKMLHGASIITPLSNENEEKPATRDVSIDQADISDDEESYKSSEGYFSLLDYINFSPNSKIRVFLAPKKCC